MDQQDLFLAASGIPVIAELGEIGFQHSTFCETTGAIIVSENSLCQPDIRCIESTHRASSIPEPATAESANCASPIYKKRQKLNGKSPDPYLTLLRQTRRDLKGAYVVYQQQNQAISKMLEQLAKSSKH